MQIELAQIPEKAINKAIKSVENGNVFLDASHDGKPMELACSHPVYYGGIDVIKEKKSLVGAARFVSWRTIIVSGEEALADIVVGPKNIDKVDPFEEVKYEFNSSTQGPLIDSLVKALGDLENDPTPGTYNLALLRVPALYLEFIWLQGDTQDWLVSIGSFYEDTITHFKLYKPEDMYDIVALEMEKALN